MNKMIVALGEGVFSEELIEHINSILKKEQADTYMHCTYEPEVSDIQFIITPRESFSAKEQKHIVDLICDLLQQFVAIPSLTNPDFGIQCDIAEDSWELVRPIVCFSGLRKVFIKKTNVDMGKDISSKLLGLQDFCRSFDSQGLGLHLDIQSFEDGYAPAFITSYLHDITAIDAFYRSWGIILTCFLDAERYNDHFAVALSEDCKKFFS